MIALSSVQKIKTEDQSKQKLHKLVDIVEAIEANNSNWAVSKDDLDYYY